MWSRKCNQACHKLWARGRLAHPNVPCRTEDCLHCGCLWGNNFCLRCWFFTIFSRMLATFLDHLISLRGPKQTHHSSVHGQKVKKVREDQWKMIATMSVGEQLLFEMLVLPHFLQECWPLPWTTCSISRGQNRFSIHQFMVERSRR